MSVWGFTFVRDGVRLAYPFEPSLLSLMQLCDQVVVNVGIGSDDTLQRVRALDDGSLQIFESVWDPKLRQGGAILAQQTDLALDRCQGDWCVYLQADEVLHEKDLAAIREAIKKADARDDVDALLFSYLHFYGSYHTVGQSRRWYRHEIRAFKSGRDVRSYKDAQGFRRHPPGADPRGKKLRVLDSGARIFHYGWVRPPDKMLAKTRHFEKLYRSDSEVESILQSRQDQAGYCYEVDEKVQVFRQSHPGVMQDFVDGMDWEFAPQSRCLRWRHLREDLLDLGEHVTGHRFFEYKNYHHVR